MGPEKRQIVLQKNDQWIMTMTMIVAMIFLITSQCMLYHTTTITHEHLTALFFNIQYAIQCTALPFLYNTEVFLFPFLALVVFIFILNLVSYPFGFGGWNASRIMAHLYFESG